MNRATSSCPSCGRNISLSNIHRHTASCSRRPAKQPRTRSDIQLSIPEEIRVQRARTAAMKRAEQLRRNRTQRIAELNFDLLSQSEKRERILIEQNFTCQQCPTGTTWQGAPLTLELDHIDGNPARNDRDNLRLLCPNCHQQTPTYKNKKREAQRTYSDEEIVDALKSSSSAASALRRLGMNQHGRSYRRLLRVVANYALDLPYKV